MLGGMGPKRTPVFSPRFEIRDGWEFGGSGEVGDGLADPEIPGREGVRISTSPHRHDIGGPRANPWEGKKVRPKSFRVRIVEVEFPVNHSLSDRSNGGGPAARHSGLMVITKTDQGQRIRKQVSEAQPRSGDPCAVALGEASGNGRGAGNADLLANDHPNNGLKSIPATDNTKTRARGHERAQQPITSKVSVGRLHVVIKPKKAAHPGHLIDDRLIRRQMSGEEKLVGLMVVGGGEIKLNNTRMATDRHGSTVGRDAVIIRDK